MLLFFSKMKVLLWNKKRKNNPLLSKSTLKYLVYCQVFWVEVRRLQDQCISIWALVFYYCDSNNLLAEKLWYKCNNINEVFPNMFSNKIYIFLYKKVKVKKIFIVVVWVFLIFVFFFFSFCQCFFSVSCYVRQFLGDLHLLENSFLFLRTAICSS